MWIIRHQRSGMEIYYTFDIYDSSKGWITKPNLRDMRVFLTKVLNTNSKGFRGKREYSYAKDPNKVRILILGDSFTFGEGVSDNETYAYYLQEMLPDAEVINMGVHGYGHDQMLVLLREEGIKYKPDIIILGFLAMDMPRNILEFKDYAKPKFVLTNGKLKLTGTPVSRPEDILKWDWTRFRTFELFSILYHRLTRSSVAMKEKKEVITRAILAEFITLADSVRATPILVYLPCGDEILDPTPTVQDERFLLSMRQTSDKVRCFSIRPYFAEKIAKGAKVRTQGHWGPESHFIAAEAIKRYLVEEGYVASSK